MKFELTKKNKFFILASLVFFVVSVVFSAVSGLLFSQITFMKVGPLSGIGGWIYGLVGVTGVIVGLLVGTLIALVINLKIGKKWEAEFGQSEGERGAERVRITCLSFLMFLVLLWGLIVLIAEL